MILIETINEMSDFVDESSNSNLKSSNRTNKFVKMQKSFENDYNNYNNQDNNLSDTKSSKFKKMDSDTSFTMNSHNHYNNQSDVKKHRQHQHKNEKIKTLKNKIEKQMKDYVDREDYDEMIKLVKKLNLISDDKWEELESEVEKLDYSDVHEYKSTAGFLTDDEIAILAQDLGQKNRQSTPFNPEDNRQQGTEMVNLKLNYGHKRSILRKLMIAQRKQFLFKKEQADLQKAKKEFDDTSVSNFSQISGHVGGPGAEEKIKAMNDPDKDANYK